MLLMDDCSRMMFCGCCCKITLRITWWRSCCSDVGRDVTEDCCGGVHLRGYLSEDTVVSGAAELLL